MLQRVVGTTASVCGGLMSGNMHGIVPCRCISGITECQVSAYAVETCPGTSVNASRREVSFRVPWADAPAAWRVPWADVPAGWAVSITVIYCNYHGYLL